MSWRDGRGLGRDAVLSDKVVSFLEEPFADIFRVEGKTFKMFSSLKIPSRTCQSRRDVCLICADVFSSQFVRPYCLCNSTAEFLEVGIYLLRSFCLLGLPNHVTRIPGGISSYFVWYHLVQYNTVLVTMVGLTDMSAPERLIIWRPLKNRYSLNFLDLWQGWWMFWGRLPKSPIILRRNSFSRMET
jgi:hypothetical protein